MNRCRHWRPAGGRERETAQAPMAESPSGAAGSERPGLGGSINVDLHEAGAM